MPALVDNDMTNKPIRPNLLIRGYHSITVKSHKATQLAIIKRRPTHTHLVKNCN